MATGKNPQGVYSGGKDPDQQETNRLLRSMETHLSRISSTQERLAQRSVPQSQTGGSSGSGGGGGDSSFGRTMNVLTKAGSGAATGGLIGGIVDPVGGEIPGMIIGALLGWLWGVNENKKKDEEVRRQKDQGIQQEQRRHNVLNQVVLATVAGLTSFYEGVVATTHVLRDLGGAASSMGGSAGQVAGLRAYGLSSGDAVSIGRSIRQMMTLGSGNMMSMIALGRAGLSPQLPAFLAGASQTNEAQLTLQLLTNLYSKSRQDQLGILRTAGLEGLMSLLNVSPETQTVRQHMLRRAGSIDDERSVRAANDFHAATSAIMQSLGMLQTATNKGAIEPITAGLRNIAEAIGHAAEFFNKNQEVPKAIGGVLRLVFDGIAGGIRFLEGVFRALSSIKLPSWMTGGGKFDLTTETGIKAIEGAWMNGMKFIYNITTATFEGLYSFLIHLLKGIPGVGGAFGGMPGSIHAPKWDDIWKQMADATNANTAATKANTQASKDQLAYAQSQFGGGPRAHNTVPTGLQGLALKQFMEHQTLPLGGLGYFSS